MATSFIMDYARRLERVLLAQRDVSGILKHHGEAGAAREFFVESILRRVLPASIVVGCGEIIDRTGARSKQQDLLLYRDNFPIIDSLAGSHVYFAEGVLATIEVKSLLTGDEIGRATENIRSVALETGEDGLVNHEPVEGGDLSMEDWSQASMARRLLQGRGAPQTDPLLSPPAERIWTFVFAFGGLSLATTRDHARQCGWYGTSDGPDGLCVLGGSKGTDSKLGIFGANRESPFRSATPGADGDAFFIDETEDALGWWLANLIWVVSRPGRWPLLRPYLPTS